MDTQFSNPVCGVRRTFRRRTRGGESGQTVMLYTILLPFLVIPMVGIAMDTTKVFIVREKLQGSVDGAAIAAAQNMNTGSTVTEWQTSAQATATQFVNASFPDGYFSATNKVVTATVPTPKAGDMMRTVSIYGSVQVALAFPSLLGFGKFSVSASGQATRRDVVLVMVIDRSGSMNEIADVQAAAKAFVGDFTPGRDRLALVLMGGSSIIAYPSQDWNVDPFNGTLAGPLTSFSTDSPSITTQLTNMAHGSNTGTAESMWYAYQELAKANQKGALNVIVLFTDGMPNGITAVFNGNNPGGLGTASGAGNNGTSVRVAKVTGATPSDAFADGGGASTCAHMRDGATNPMKGWIALQGGYANTGDTTGIDQLAQFMTSSSLATLVASPGTDQQHITTNSGGCFFAANHTQVSKDVVIPDYDYYGDSTWGIDNGFKSDGVTQSTYSKTDYQKSEIYNSTTACNKVSLYDPYHDWVRTSTTLTTYGSANSCQVGLGSWNAADMAAYNIRLKGAAAGLSPLIYVMGYAGNNGNNNSDDPVLMLRMSNVKSYKEGNTTYDNSVFDKTYPPGMYIRMTSTDDIGPAFNAVASQIVRLSM